MMSDFDVCLISGYGVSANLEVEAQIAKMMYHLNTAPSIDEFSRRYEEINDKGMGRKALQLMGMLNGKGRLNSNADTGEFVGSFRSQANDIVAKDNRYIFNQYRSVSQNISNLQTLSRDC